MRIRPPWRCGEGLRSFCDWYSSQAKSPEELLENEVVRNWEPQPKPDPCLENSFQSRSRSLGQEEVSAAGRAILSGWVTQGPEVAAFEREFAAFVGRPHACAVSSCTTALHLALLAVGVSRATRSSRSAIRTSPPPTVFAIVVRKPVFVDIEPRTFNIESSTSRVGDQRPGARDPCAFTRWACRATCGNP